MAEDNRNINELVRESNGFTFLRYVFVYIVISAHFCVLSDTDMFWITNGQVGVKAFFCISGFLVSYSFLRHDNLKKYFQRRAVRLFPPYFAVVALAFLLGWLVSTYPVADYFTSAQSYRYLFYNLCFMNFLEPSLPGVFEHNVMSAVNGSLWFVRLELVFCCLLPLLLFVFKKFGKWAMLGLAVFCFFLYIASGFVFDHLTHEKLLLNIYLFMFFIAGMMMFVFFKWFYRFRFLMSLIGIGGVALSVYSDVVLVEIFEPLWFAMAIIGFAYVMKPLGFVDKIGDITYGLFLYHFPVIQCVVNFRLHEQNPYLAFVIVLIITITLSALSKIYIEKSIRKLLENRNYRLKNS